MQPGRGLGSVLGRLGRTTRMRLAIVLAVVLSFAYALATGAIPGVSAVFTADTGNTGAQFHGGWIDQATNPQIVVSGYGAQMSWTAGATGVAAEEIDAADGGTGAAASVARIGSIPNLAVGKTGTTAATVSVVGAVVTVRAGGGGQNISGTGTFTASASITSSNGGAGACTANFCQVTGIVSGF